MIGGRLGIPEILIVLGILMLLGDFIFLVGATLLVRLFWHGANGP